MALHKLSLGVCVVLSALLSCSSQPEVVQSQSQDAGVTQEASTDASIVFDVTVQDVGFESCATSQATASLSPLALYIMMDKSGSMTGARWQALTSALNAFVTDPAHAELTIGLKFFPLAGAGVCDAASYAQAEVPMASCETNATPFADAIAKHKPDGETPTLPALQGAITYATSWLKDHNDHKVAVVLATDGEPNVCGSTVDKVAAVARVAYESATPIQTFVIGVGPALDSLNAVAKAGGTTSAYLVDDTTQSASAAFAQALTDIRGRALSCEFEIPSPATGTLDPDKVNVILTKDKTKPITIPRVKSSAECSDTAQGWYYDNPDHPTSVLLCKSTCEDVQDEAAGTIEVVFGCVTVIA